MLIIVIFISSLVYFRSNNETNNMSVYKNTCILMFSSLKHNVKYFSSSLSGCHHGNSPGCRKFYTSTILEKVVPFKLSDIGEGIKEVVIKEWFVKVGDKVSQFDNICEVQSDKASVTITSRYDGLVTKLHHTVDQTVQVGQALVDIDTEEGDDSVDVKNHAADVIEDSSTSFNEVEREKTDDSMLGLCIPSVRRLAKQNNIDLKQVTGTGKKGRILKEDIISYLQNSSVEKIPPSEDLNATKADRTVPITGFQKAMVKTMTEALKIPHFVYSDEISVLNLTKIRNSLKQETVKNNIKISFMPFFIKAASNALLKYPILNASLDDKCENVTYKTNHNIGIAMDTAVGLAVPVIKNVQEMSVIEIAKKLNKLIQSGKTGNFSTEDLSGGTFSISNIGIIGGTYTKPVILPPQVSIIAIGTAKVVPKFDESMQIVPDEVVCISGAADHRIIDGVTMANFVTAIKKQIENPHLLFLHL